MRGKAGFFVTRPKTKGIFNVLWRFVAGFLKTRQKSYIWCIISRFSHDAPKRYKFAELLREKQVFPWPAKNSYIWCINTWKTKSTFDALLRFVAGFPMTHKKFLYLIHYYVEKQVFSWRAKKVQICCIIAWKSSFSHDAPKTLIFDTLSRGKAGYLMTHPKGANLLHYYVSKQFFSWRAKKGANLLHYYVSKQIFSRCAKNSYIWCTITWKRRFSHDTPKRCKFVALFREKAGFLMTHQNSYISCIYTWKSRFSHDATKTKCTSDALLCFVVDFLLKRQKPLYLMHYYVDKQVFSWHDRKQNVHLMHYYVSQQVFSWRAKNFYIWWIITWKGRFSHEAPKRCRFVALLRFEAGFLMTRPKGAN